MVVVLRAVVVFGAAVVFVPKKKLRETTRIDAATSGQRLLYIYIRFEWPQKKKGLSDDYVASKNFASLDPIILSSATTTTKKERRTKEKKDAPTQASLAKAMFVVVVVVFFFFLLLFLVKDFPI